MRVSDTMQYETMRQSIAQARESQLEASNVASSGSRLIGPSTDPVAAAQAIRTQAAIDRTSDFRANIRNARGDLDLAESTLAEASDTMNRAHEISLQAASGQLSDSERQDLAEEVSQLKDQLTASANTKGALGYLFGGTKSQSAPFVAGAFVGDDNDRTIEVSSGVTAGVSASGAKAFTVAGGRDLFGDLDTLESALTSNDPVAAAATVNNLDAGARQVTAARVDAGLKLARLDAADAVHAQAAVTLTNQEHTLVDADPTDAYSRLVQTQQNLQSAITVSRSMLDLMQRTTTT